MSNGSSPDNDELDFFASLDSDPPTRPGTLRGGDATERAPARGSTVKLLEFAGIALISAALTAALVVWTLGPRDNRPQPSIDAATLGRGFVPKLAGALADGFEAGAEAIQAGKSLGEADALLKTQFQSARAKAFDDHAGPAIHRIVPDGQEFKDEAARQAMIEFFDGFAQGLRETR